MTRVTSCGNEPRPPDGARAPQNTYCRRITRPSPLSSPLALLILSVFAPGVVGGNLHRLVGVPVDAQGMGLALGVADLAGGAVDDDVVILDLDRVVAVEQLPGADFLVLRLDGVELGAVQLVEAARR